MTNFKLPVTRYYGSKRKLLSQIWHVFDTLDLDFSSVLDVFGGSGIFSYYAKIKNKQIFYNDIFRFNYLIGKALIENHDVGLTEFEVLNLIKPIEGKEYKSIIEDNFCGIYFTDIENKQIDIIVQNIDDLSSEEKKSSAYYLLFQSCIIKRPYNLFHRKNLNLRIDYKGGRFGNKVTWERSFEELFLRFYEELKEFTFDNNYVNHSSNFSALNCEVKADLVYIDPPYFGLKSHTSYHEKYHFLEGLAHYDTMQDYMDTSKRHNEVIINKSAEFDQRDNFLRDLELLILKHTDSILAISYRSNGYPSINSIAEALSKYKKNVSVIDLGNYNYALSRNNINNFEYLIVGC